MAMNKFKMINFLPTVPLGIIMDHQSKGCSLSRSSQAKDDLCSFMGFKELLKYTDKSIYEDIKIVHTTLLGTSNASLCSGMEKKNDIGVIGVGKMAQVTPQDTPQLALSAYIDDTEGSFDELICWIEKQAGKYAFDQAVLGLGHIRQNI
jgi:hypothetical protein